LGVDAAPVKEKVNVEWAPVDTAKAPAGAVTGTTGANGFLIDGKTNSELVATLELLSHGAKAYRLLADAQPKSAVYLRSGAFSLAALNKAARKWSIQIRGTRDAVHGSALALQAPRIALYQAYGSPMDEGWTRWIFDQYGIHYSTLVNKDIRAGGLREKYDAVILPDGSAAAIFGAGRGGRGGGGGGGALPPELPAA
jgi:hypothetical protein